MPSFPIPSQPFAAPLSFGANKPASQSTSDPSLQALLANIQQRFQAEPLLQQCHALSESRPDTLEQFRTSSQPPFRFSPQRQALHQQILDHQLTPFLQKIKASPTEKAGHKQVHIVTGLPGSGKSSVVVEKLAQSHPKAFVLDMDELAKDLPEYHVPVSFAQYQLNQRNGLGAKATHREAQYLARQIFNQLTEQGHSLIMSYVGEKVAEETALIQQLSSQGYAVFLHHVQVRPQTAIDRVLQRFKETGRYVSPFYVAQLGNQSTEAFQQLIGQQQLVQGYTLSHNEASP
jgi:predicted ABC-type ATPase